MLTTGGWLHMVGKLKIWILMKCFITAQKQSLGQGNIFTPVCHSVHGGVCVVAPWGMHGCSRGACLVAPQWGACLVAPWGVCVAARGACMVLFGGCVVLFGGHAWFYLEWRAWFYLGGMHGFIWRGVCGFIQGEGACMVFSVFSDTMRYSQ